MGLTLGNKTERGKSRARAGGALALLLTLLLLATGVQPAGALIEATSCDYVGYEKDRMDNCWTLTAIRPYDMREQQYDVLSIPLRTWTSWKKGSDGHANNIWFKDLWGYQVELRDWRGDYRLDSALIYAWENIELRDLDNDNFWDYWILWDKDYGNGFQRIITYKYIEQQVTNYWRSWISLDYPVGSYYTWGEIPQTARIHEVTAAKPNDVAYNVYCATTKTCTPKPELTLSIGG